MTGFMHNGERVVSTAEAARRIGVWPATVRKALERKDSGLEAVKLYGRWYVVESSIPRYAPVFGRGNFRK